MTTLLTGYSSEQELVSINSGNLSFSIFGKASHINSDKEVIEYTSQVICHDYKNEASIKVYESETAFGEGKTIIESIPLFYEQRDYEIRIDYLKDKPDDVVEFWHDSVHIRNKVKDRERLQRDIRTSLSGVINFKNEIGFSELIVKVNGEVYLRVEIEIYPSKIDYQKDYQKLITEVTQEVYNLAFDFLKRTYQYVGLTDFRGNTNNEFISLIRIFFNEMMSSLDLLISKAHRELTIEQQIVPSYKAKKIDNKTIKWMANHPQRGLRDNADRIRFDKVQTGKKTISYDTYENQYIKFIAEITLRRLKSIKSVLSNERSYAKEDVIDVLKELNDMIKEIERRLSYSFLSEISPLSQVKSLSLVFTMAPGYREFYKCYLKINKGLSLRGDIFHISMKDTAELYEYWCFIKLNSIIGEMTCDDGTLLFERKSNDVLNTDGDGLTLCLRKGTKSEVKYVNKENGDLVTISYNSKYINLPTVTQRPDNVFSLTKTNNGITRQYVFDAKYKINMALEGSSYKQTYKTPGPEEEDINTMHRYRDSIVDIRNGYDKFMTGAYVLFPYSEEDEYKNHKFYKSISTVNIGGLPFLPLHTKLVRKLLKTIMSE